MNKQKKLTQKQIIEDLQSKNLALTNNNIKLKKENEEAHKTIDQLNQDRNNFENEIIEKMTPLIDSIKSSEEIFDFFESMYTEIDFSMNKEFMEILYDAADDSNSNYCKRYVKLLILYDYEDVEKLFKLCDEEMLELYLDEIYDVNIIIDEKSLYEIYREKSQSLNICDAHGIFMQNDFIFDNNNVERIFEVVRNTYDDCDGMLYEMDTIMVSYSDQEKPVRKMINKILHNTTTLPTDIINLITKYNINYCKKCNYIHINYKLPEDDETISEVMCRKKLEEKIEKKISG